MFPPSFHTTRPYQEGRTSRKSSHKVQDRKKQEERKPNTKRLRLEESKPPENRHCWGLFSSCRPESRPPFTKAARLSPDFQIFHS
ncbi:unnamed protein product [Cuscuta europaea]|uniref:Uncharacterized protein n=1 Tax=Cuscuta europaea TaxID=41803 RepID=A0A9P1DYJ6_CUSEU|nr:unnamed protein product [Cuscuta europaea]